MAYHFLVGLGVGAAAILAFNNKQKIKTLTQDTLKSGVQAVGELKERALDKYEQLSSEINSSKTCDKGEICKANTHDELEANKPKKRATKAKSAKISTKDGAHE